MATTPLPVDRELDCRGMLCPMPVLMTSKEMKKLQVGQTLKMTATDPGSKADMASWSRQTGHELLAAEEGSGVFVFYIRRAK